MPTQGRSGEEVTEVVRGGNRKREKRRKLTRKKGFGGEERRKKESKARWLEGNELLHRWRANRVTLPADFGRLLDPTLDEERRGDL